MYRATDAYVAGLGSRLPGDGGLDRVSRAPTRPSLEEVGGIEGGRSAWLNGRMKKAAGRGGVGCLGRALPPKGCEGRPSNPRHPYHARALFLSLRDKFRDPLLERASTLP